MTRGRRRLAVVLAAVAALATVAGILVGRSGGPPQDTLARLVPADALLYAHAWTGEDREASAALVRTLEKLPGLRALRDRALTRVGGRSSGFSFARDIRPWLDDEAAFALLPAPGGRTAEGLLVARVRDRDLARLFAARAGAQDATRHRGTEILRLANGSSAAVGDEILAVGPEARVRAVLDLAEDGGRGLDAAPGFARTAVEGLDERALELYATGAGARGTLAPRAGALRGLLAAPDLDGLRAAVAPARDGVRVRLRAARRSGAPASFVPDLARAAPTEAAGVLALTSADPLVRRLLAAAPGLDEVAREAGVDLERDVLAPLRGGEVALWAAPGDPVPGVALAARTRDPARTREALGRLAGPLATALAPAGAAGQVPALEQRDIDGATAFALGLGPGVELVYAVFGDRVVVATTADAVARVRRPGPGLLTAAQGAGRIALPERGGVEAVLFTAPGQLLALGDGLGVTADPSVSAVRDDLARVRAAGVVARREGTDTTAEILLQIP